MKPWSERMIARAICHQLLLRKSIVLVENTTWTGAEADILAVCMDRRLIDIEVKISRADFKRDYHKAKWWESLWSHIDGPPKRFLWPPKVWKHYYAMPATIWKPELVDFMPSPNSGVLLLQHSDNVKSGVSVHCVRRAVPQRDCDRISEEEALDIARLANLRMWEAYAELEALKP